MSVNTLLNYPPALWTLLKAVSLQVSDDVQLTPITTTNRDAITPSDGMMIFNSTTNQFEGYHDGTWNSFGGSGATGATSPTIVLKTGSGTGDYVLDDSSDYFDVDADNLNYTTVIPVGSKLTVTASCCLYDSSFRSIALFDGSTLLAATYGGAGDVPYTVQTVIIGDGASHDISFRWASGATQTMVNSVVSVQSTLVVPTVIYRLEVAS